MDKKHFVLDRLSRRENGIRVHSDQKAGLRVLPDEDYDRWLDPKNEDVAALQGLLRPYPAEEMAAFPISTLVHSPRNDRPECIERLSA
jgi:putative SOS response-associated peptidase YedK